VTCPNCNCGRAEGHAAPRQNFMQIKEIIMKPPCKKCGHSELEHAGDRNHVDTQPCWHGAVTGDGCECKNYEEATK
jgi:hypothetical protein